MAGTARSFSGPAGPNENRGLSTKRKRGPHISFLTKLCAEKNVNPRFSVILRCAYRGSYSSRLKACAGSRARRPPVPPGGLPVLNPSHNWCSPPVSPGHKIAKTKNCRNSKSQKRKAWQSIAKHSKAYQSIAKHIKA